VIILHWEELPYLVPAALIAIVCHELSHDLVSYILGDPTPKQEKRLSLNPLRHLDPVGTICLIFFRFGWAKPVHIDPRNYRNPRLGMVFVALAGPLMNFIIAFISGFLYIASIKYFNAPNWIITFLSYLILINSGLGIFNLIPFPPLDGSKIIGALIPEKYYYTYLRYESFGIIILLVLLTTGVFDNFLYTMLNGLVNTIMKATSWI